MKSAKKAKIVITSTVEELSDSGLAESSEKTEVKALGLLSVDEGVITLSYKESTEGGEVFSEVISGGDTVRVSRKGALTSEFVFTEGTEHASLYSVGPYSFDASIKTRRIRGALTEDGGSLSLFYDMSVGGAKKSVKMKIEVAVYDNYRS